jgi:hypothetical protein
MAVVSGAMAVDSWLMSQSSQITVVRTTVVAESFFCYDGFCVNHLSGK